MAGIANIDRVPARAKRRQVAAGIDQPFGDPMVTQGFDCAVDREALGDAPEINAHATMREVDLVFGEQLDDLAEG